MNQSPYGPLGFQASGPTFGGAGGGFLKNFLMGLARSKTAAPGTASAGAQAVATAGAPGAPVPANYGQPAVPATDPTANPFAQNPYYQTGFQGRSLY